MTIAILHKLQYKTIINNQIYKINQIHQNNYKTINKTCKMNCKTFFIQTNNNWAVNATMEIKKLIVFVNNIYCVNVVLFLPNTNFYLIAIFVMWLIVIHVYMNVFYVIINIVIIAFNIVIFVKMKN